MKHFDGCGIPTGTLLLLRTDQVTFHFGLAYVFIVQVSFNQICNVFRTMIFGHLSVLLYISLTFDKFSKTRRSDAKK